MARTGKCAGEWTAVLVHVGRDVRGLRRDVDDR